MHVGIQPVENGRVGLKRGVLRMTKLISETTIQKSRALQSKCSVTTRHPLCTQKKKLGRGFTACHVWRQVRNSDALASRDPRTNSFVPNLVWLPTQLAKLSDREDSFVQGFLQSISRKVYRNVEPAEPLKIHAECAWSLLPEDRNELEIGIPDPSQLNYLVPNKKFFKYRMQRTADVVDLISSRLEGSSPTRQIAKGRYFEGLSRLGRNKPISRKRELMGYLDDVQRGLDLEAV